MQRGLRIAVEKLRRGLSQTCKTLKSEVKRGAVVPVLLAELGAGVFLTLLLRHAGALRNRISGKVQGQRQSGANKGQGCRGKRRGPDPHHGIA